MRGPLIRGKDFEAFIGQGKQAQRKVMKVCQRREEYLMWEEEKRRRMNV